MQTEEKKRSAFDILLSPLKHLGNVLGITGVHILSVILLALGTVAKFIAYGIVALVAMVLIWDLALGHAPVALPKMFYILLVVGALLAVFIKNLILYMAEYFDSFAFHAEEALQPKFTPTTEEPTIHIVYQDATKPMSNDDIVVEGEYTEKEF